MTRISRALDLKTRTMPVELTVANANQLFAPGVYPSVSWPALSALHRANRLERSAAFFNASPRERKFQIERGYVTGMQVPAPSVVMLNGAVANIAVTELAMWIAGTRALPYFVELDILGTGRPAKGQWVTPTSYTKNTACAQCLAAGIGDDVDIERYARKAGTSSTSAVARDN